jgi:hypothetical protein
LTLGYYLLNDMRSDPARIQANLPYIVGVAVVYLMGLVLILFYAVFDSYRYRVTEEGLLVRGLFGWKLTRWTDVSRGFVASTRGINLVLLVGPRRLVRLPLGNYHRARSLLEAVSQRLRIPVEVPPHLESYITDK